MVGVSIERRLTRSGGSGGRSRWAFGGVSFGDGAGWQRGWKDGDGRD